MAYKNDTGFPSVTQILSPWIETEWYTEESRERGSVVHAAAFAYLKNLWVPPLKKEHQLYFDSFRRWADCYIDKFVFGEERLVDEKTGYCGQPDFLLVTKYSPSRILVDLKTSQSKQKWWSLQLIAYKRLVNKTKGDIIHRSLSLRTKKDGSGCLADEYCDDDVSWNYFRSALNMWRFFK